MLVAIGLGWECLENDFGEGSKRRGDDVERREWTDASTTEDGRDVGGDGEELLGVEAKGRLELPVSLARGGREIEREFQLVSRDLRLQKKLTCLMSSGPRGEPWTFSVPCLSDPKPMVVRTFDEKWGQEGSRGRKDGGTIKKGRNASRNMGKGH